MSKKPHKLQPDYLAALTDSEFERLERWAKLAAGLPADALRNLASERARRPGVAEPTSVARRAWTPDGEY